MKLFSKASTLTKLFPKKNISTLLARQTKARFAMPLIR